MNKDIINVIEQLSKADNKTLAQKALKTSEEVGELAKVVLPFDGAHATNHRFVDRNRILEEVADVILCAMSVAFELDFASADVGEMMKEKSNKWAYLLRREEEFTDKTPYEVHITVRTKDLDRFKIACAALEVKPIIIDLQNKLGESVMKDVMTSSVHLGNNPSAYAEMERIAAGLTRMGLEVIRKKIETVPWHPAAPQKDEDKMPKDCYFESHFAIVCDDNNRERLKDLAGALGCHMSRNIFKRLDGGKYKIMLTYRSYDCGSETFEKAVSKINETLKLEEFEVDKTIIEFSVYDTKVSHDAEWINK